MLIGTAGHIDHGKTALIKALTGVDADRLPQEQARGMSLDLGYAYLPLATGEVLGFIDVPGHEKLIRHMLAGATGIDHLLLVVAADDGPMPQTREHLSLAGLLGLRQGAVVLSKVDAVDGARRQAARAELATLLTGSALATAPRFEVSVRSGEGLAALRAHLYAAAAAHDPPAVSGHFRLAIDRCFTLKGIGSVVTGTAHAGKLGAGEAALILPAGAGEPLAVRVRSLHVQDRPAQEARAGQRCALALVGDFEKTAIVRGQWLVAPALQRCSQRLHVAIRAAPGLGTLRQGTAIHCHIGTADITGRLWRLDGEELAAGEAGFAEIRLDAPTAARHGDRFVVRDAAARHSLAGGRVLDAFPPGRHKRAAAHLSWLAALEAADPAQALAFRLQNAPTGVDLAAFADNGNLDAASCAALVARLQLKLHGTSAFTAAGWAAMQARVKETLAREHREAPDLAGVARERLRRMSLPTLDRGVFAALVAEALAQGQLAQSHTWLHLPEHRARLAPADLAHFASVRPWLGETPYKPPRVRELARACGLAEDELRQLCKRLARAGELYPLAHDHFFTARAVADLAAVVAMLCARDGAARAAALRDAIYPEGGGRKVAIQILEFFDRVGYTRRVRDEHVLRGGADPAPWPPR